MSTRHSFFLGLFYFSFSRISSALIPLASSFFSGLSICLCLLRFQGCHFFFGLLQNRLLLFQRILLLLDCFLDGCDLSIQRCNSLLLLCDLGYLVFDDIGFRTVFAAFRSGHGDNLFPFYSCLSIALCWGVGNITFFSQFSFRPLSNCQNPFRLYPPYSKHPLLHPYDR